MEWQRRSPKPEGLNKETALPQQPMATNESIEDYNRRAFAYNSIPVEMDLDQPIQHPMSPVPSPSIRGLFDQLEQPPKSRVPRLPQPSLPSVEQLAAVANLKDNTSLEDWERFYATRNERRDSKNHPLREPEFEAPDGTNFYRFRGDEYNSSSHVNMDSSFLPFTSDPSLYDQESTNTAAKPSGTSNAAARFVTAKRLIVKLRYGRHNRRKVANLVKLPVKRRSDDGENSKEKSREVKVGGRLLPYHKPTLSNDEAERATVSLAKNNKRISPDESSNAVMRRFEHHAKDLEVASRVATDASSRSISDDEEIVVAVPDTSRKAHSEVSSEGESPAAPPLDLFINVPPDKQPGQTTHGKLDHESEVPEDRKSVV